MKIWTLAENTACCSDLTAEHGLSLYIETGNHRILFDAGQTEAFWDNAEKLGIDLAGVDIAVLSHGHYDHGGGMPRFFRCNSHAKFYVNQYAFESHYHGPERYIGLDLALLNSDRLVFTVEETRLAPGITLHTCCHLPYPMDDGGLQVLEDGVWKPDDFRHEQYLLIEEGGKRVLFSGCSHRGILNIMAGFQPDVLIGGFHFMKITDEAVLKQAGEVLGSYPTRYYTGHCTGQAQFACLKAILGERLRSISTGTLIQI